MKDRRIAILEDAADIALLEQELLKSEGAKVDLIDPHMYKTTDWHQYDVAVVDILLGDIWGIDVLKWLRLTHPALTLVAVSAAIPYLDQAREYSDICLEKPYLISHLAEAIRNHAR